MDCSLPGSSVHGDSPGKNTGVGCHALLQGIFPTQGLNPGLPHCRWILYLLSHLGTPWILEWVAYRFSRGSSRPRKLNSGSPELQEDSLPTELPGKPPKELYFGAKQWLGCGEEEGVRSRLLRRSKRSALAMIVLKRLHWKKIANICESIISLFTFLNRS